MKRAIIAASVTLAALAAPAQTALAHGGSDIDLTDNYRTRVTEVPSIEGLAARAIGLDGTIELAWHGAGTVIVSGYQGEPYLRFDNSGVSRNLRSPATYLNEDRYATTPVPADADPDADPQWQRLTTEPRWQWHDHRTHWMSPAPPPAAQAEPNRTHLIYPRWELDLQVDGEPAVIAGDLTWAPPPPLLGWITLTLLSAIAATSLLWSRWWRPAAAGLAIIGITALVLDTVGFVLTMNDTLSNRLAAFLYTAIAAAATLRLVIHAARRTEHPTLAMMLTGTILFIFGGLDRIDVLTSGFYFSALPITLARIATIICLSTGTALLARFGRFLAPLLTARTASTASPATPQPTPPTPTPRANRSAPTRPNPTEITAPDTANLAPGADETGPNRAAPTIPQPTTPASQETR